MPDFHVAIDQDVKVTGAIKLFLQRLMQMYHLHQLLKITGCSTESR